MNGVLANDLLASVSEPFIGQLSRRCWPGQAIFRLTTVPPRQPPKTVRTRGANAAPVNRPGFGDRRADVQRVVVLLPIGLYQIRQDKRRLTVLNR
jgi:hypothetical protein